MNSYASARDARIKLAMALFHLEAAGWDLPHMEKAASALLSGALCLFGLFSFVLIWSTPAGLGLMGIALFVFLVSLCLLFVAGKISSEIMISCFRSVDRTHPEFAMAMEKHGEERVTEEWSSTTL